ncbi:MAG: chemotaxis protein CheA [Rubrivivax sp.]
MNDDRSVHHEAFFDEAGDALDRMDTLLLRADTTEGLGRDDLDAIFRCAHSIKGAAGALGFEAIAALTHHMETLLERWRRGALVADGADVDLLLQASDAVRARIATCRSNAAADGDADGGNDAALLQALQQRALVLEAGTPAAPPRELHLHLGPLSGADVADDVVEMFADMPELGRIEALPDEFAHDSVKRFVLCTHSSDAELLTVIGMHLPSDKVRLLNLAAPPTPPRAVAPSEAADATRVRVPAQKIDHLIDLAGELLIAHSALAQACTGLDAPRQALLADALAALERLIRELQHAVMSMRMVPVSLMFSRFPRLLRELSTRLGKQIDLHTEGETTELDKGMVEGLSDPLLHLLRNACDHGIETPAERLAQGKPAAGRITVRAAHESASMLIEVQDDGRGLCRRSLLQKAREHGVPADDSISDEQAWELAFLPGLSTARQLSEVSGRGVGMDVVRRNIAALGGTVTLRSTAGQGTTASLRVPLTLAVIDAVSVAVGDQYYVVPLASVVEAVTPRSAHFHVDVNGRQCLRLREQSLPLIDTQRLFDTPPGDADERAVYLVVEAQHERAALRVDRLLGQHPAVVKSLPTPLRHAAQASGATILGDGRVALILDTDQLVRQACTPVDTP